MPGEARAATEPGPGREGVVVEVVGEGSALAKAGIQPGDALLSWRRLPRPPANPDEARGKIASIFDWMWLELEQAPRGPMLLDGRRDGAARSFSVPAGSWEAEVRPREAADDRDARTWLLLRLAEAARAQGAYEKADESLQTARELAGDGFAASVVLRAIGHGHASRGELEPARLAFDAAREIRERISGGDSLALAETLNDLGLLVHSQGDLERAASHHRRALEIRRRNAPGSRVAVQSLSNLAAVDLERGAVSRAEASFEKALAVLERLSPDSLDVATVRHNLAAVAHERGDLEAATREYRRALEIRERLAPDGLDTAETLNNLGTVALARGELDLATSLLERAVGIQERRAPGSLEVAAGLSNLGGVAWHRGDLAPAENYFERALEIEQRLAPGSLGVAASLDNLGTLAANRGELQAATWRYQRALEIRQNQAPDSLAIAYSFNNLGHVAWRRKDYERARDAHRRALAIRRAQAPGSLEVAHSLNNLGAVAFELGDLEAAESQYLQALAIEEELAPSSLGVATSLTNLGLVARREGRLLEARELQERALAVMADVSPSGLEVARILAHLASLAEERGELERAEEAYRQALDVARHVAPDSALVAEIHHGLGTVHRRSRPPRTDRALEHLHRAIDVLENQLERFGGSYFVRAGFRARFSGYYRATLELELELGRHAAAFRSLERSRARGFLERLAERDTVFTADVPAAIDGDRRRLAVLYDRAQKALAERNPRDHAGEIASLHEELRRLHEQAADLEARIRGSSPRLAALRYPEPLDLEGARAALDPGTALLAYSVGEAGTALFVVSRERPLEVHALAIDAASLREQVARFRGQVHGRGWSRRRESRHELGLWLYERLMAPAEAGLAAADRLLIVPDGALHILPFAALARPRGGNAVRPWQYLVEWKPIHVVLSTTVYAELLKNRRPNEDGASTSLVAFGDPRYARHASGEPSLLAAAQRGFDLAALPHSRHEVASIARLFPGARTYLGSEATEERAKTIGKDTRILHFATHGQLDDRLPFNSFVALTIPEEYSEDRDNGLLQVWEVFERVRLDADLLVLSACESALGEELSGEGLIGLTRAFQYAGARSVAATLWKVADQTTAVLMERFYRHLRAGRPKDEALRAAQLELIRVPIEVTDEAGQIESRDASAPYYWAAFQIYGDWR